jgi:3-hydroxyisobutyrate dehydrogenase
MMIAYEGGGALDQAVLEQLRRQFRVEVVADAAALERVAGDCEVLVLGSGAGQEIAEQLANWPRSKFGRIATVVDQRVVDPDDTRRFAEALQRSGIALVDAPIHCDDTSVFPERAAALCGGAQDALARVRPVLEAMGAKLIHFGDVGAGVTARVLVGAAAVCNRMATYECAAAGFSNGLSIADMALVLNRSSGANSASEYVLPHIGTSNVTTHMPIAAVANEMRLASQLAMRAGTPLLLPGVVGELCQSLANQVTGGVTFDAAATLMEAAAGLRDIPH